VFYVVMCSGVMRCVVCGGVMRCVFCVKVRCGM